MLVLSAAQGLWTAPSPATFCSAAASAAFAAAMLHRERWAYHFMRLYIVPIVLVGIAVALGFYMTRRALLPRTDTGGLIWLIFGPIFLGLVGAVVGGAAIAMYFWKPAVRQYFTPGIPGKTPLLLVWLLVATLSVLFGARELHKFVAKRSHTSAARTVRQCPSNGCPTGFECVTQGSSSSCMTRCERCNFLRKTCDGC